MSVKFSIIIITIDIGIHCNTRDIIYTCFLLKANVISFELFPPVNFLFLLEDL